MRDRSGSVVNVMILRTCLLLASAALVLAAHDGRADDATSPVFPHPERIRYDSHCFQIEGRDTFLYGGAFHYFRVPRELWADRFRAMKAAGFNVAETYVPWNYHEREAPAGPEDFSKINLEELDAWLRLATDFGFHTIVRPGPYICAEWAGGGFPRWLLPLYKPADWPADKVWLQTDDTTYLAWNKHWYDAVGRVVAPHQITRAKVGAPGVILFQIENEYERLKWVPSATKARHLSALARQARAAGIEVPLVTCWTRQSRNSRDPELAGVFDFINTYPKWKIGTAFRDTVERQRAEQPYAPLASMELQGGWYSEIGGQLSENIDGIAAVQTQNLTLYCLQLGFSALNYYMLVGGTNFDDWASREATTTYDFAAAIREHGGVGERYARLAAIGTLLREHGSRLARSELIPIQVTAEDPLVQFALRRAQDGTRFLFVRTEDRTASHAGTVSWSELGGPGGTARYQLEPFGASVLVLAPGAETGTWHPVLTPPPPKPTQDLPRPFVLGAPRRLVAPEPDQWTALPEGSSLSHLDIHDSHPLHYRVRAQPGATLVVGRLGPKVVKNTLGDTVLASAGGSALAPTAEDAGSVTFQLPEGVGEAVLLHADVGLHHHTTVELEREWKGGLSRVRAGDVPLPLQVASTERAFGLRASSSAEPVDPSWEVLGPNATVEAPPGALLTWFRYEFEMPAARPGVWLPWQLRLLADGNGFLYLNGRCLGRTWEVGPQREFYLPESWLHFGTGERNVLLVSLYRSSKSPRIHEASIGPMTDFAEFRPALTGP